MKALKLSGVILLAFLFVIFCIIANPCTAQDTPSVPKLIEYNGTLEKDNGSPYPQGTYIINFEICVDELCETFIWNETHTVEISAKNKKDIDGATSYEAFFSVILGNADPVNNPLDIVFDQDLYLHVTETTLGHDNIEKFTSTASSLTSEFAVQIYDSDIDSYAEVQNVKINKAKDSDTVDGKHYADIADEIDADIDAHAALIDTHGVTGEIVGTDNDQTLTNKHISGEQIDTGKISNDRLNMGDGEGFDADMLDGYHASYFAVATHAHNFSDITGTVSDAQVPDNITVNEAKGMRALANAPSAPSAGEFYFDTDSGQKMAYIWDGSQWNEYRGPKGDKGDTGPQGESYSSPDYAYGCVGCYNPGTPEWECFRLDLPIGSGWNCDTCEGWFYDHTQFIDVWCWTVDKYGKNVQVQGKEWHR